MIADIHEVLQSRHRHNCHYLIRSRYNRKLHDQDVHLWHVLGNSAVRGHYGLELTDEQTGKTRNCQMAVRYDSYPWRIERLHYIMKSGAKIEELQLATPEQLQKAITLLSIVSLQILQLTYYARLHPELSIEQLGIPQAEWRALQAYQHKVHTSKTVSDPFSIGVWIKQLSALVGFKASKRQAFPGVKRLWMALRKWHHIYQGFCLAQNKLTYG